MNPEPAYYEEIPFEDAACRFARLAGEAGAILLDSGQGANQTGRYDIMSAAPSASLCGYIDADQVARDLDHQPLATDIFSAIEALLPSSRPVTSPLPFCGGLMGYLGYDLNCQLEKLPLPNLRATTATDFFIGYYPWALVQDRLLRRAWLVVNDARDLALVKKYKAIFRSAESTALADFKLVGSFSSNFSLPQYRAAIAQILRYIQAGDCYQVNLAQCFSAAYQGHSWGAYTRVRRQLSAPFSAYINTGVGELLCFSPERFLHTHGNRIETKPIKGTRPRGASAAEDAALADELLSSTKDRAENLMIVDLLRNDLARSCVTGSVQVEALFELESFTHVHHLVSTISGELRPEVSPLRALAAAFPGGSITGAPKIRAMEIICELENLRRSAYCGSVFYLSTDGKMDSNIIIRSLLADGKQLACWGGGGIVADSTAAAEHAETLTKVGAILRALEQP